MMAREPLMGFIAFCFIFVLSRISVTWETNRSLDRPVLSAIFILGIAGAVLLLLSKSRVPAILSGKAPLSARYLPIPAADDHDLSESYPSAPVRHSRSESNALRASHQITPQRRRSYFLTITLCIVLRVCLSNSILAAIQCTATNVESITLPVIFLVNEYGTKLRPSSDEARKDTFANSVFEDILDAVKNSKHGYLVTILMVCYGIHLTTRGMESTYLCSGAVPLQDWVPFAFQILAVNIDALAILTTWRFLSGYQESVQRIRTLGFVSLTSSILLAIISVLYLVFHPAQFPYALTTTSSLWWSIVKDALAVVTLLLAVSFLAGDLTPLAFVVISTFTIRLSSLAVHSWDNRRAFPPRPDASLISGTVFMYTAFVIFAFIYNMSESISRPRNVMSRVHWVFYVALFGVVVFITSTQIWRDNKVGFHPVKLRMWQAQNEADKWTKQASTSSNLRTAVEEYRQRYGREPPPHFDKWFEFAKSKDAVIIDDYDQIYHDLLPFWGMRPSDIRARCRVALAANDFITLTIHNGTVGLENKDNVHLVTGVNLLGLVNSVAKYLPDMILPFNIGDRPVVAIPWDKAEALRRKGRGSESPVLRRTPSTIDPRVTQDTWKPANDWETGTSGHVGGHIEPPLRLSNWDAYVVPACKPSSKARKGKYWDNGMFCPWCPRTYSLGQFIRNWTATIDICEQPDAHSLHSWLSQEATEPRTMNHKDLLTPIFSFGKTTGHNDILFPGPFTYAAPKKPEGAKKSFAELYDQLYWQGAAPPYGLEPNSWQGTLESRLVHLAHRTNTTSFSPSVPMLLSLHNCIVSKDSECKKDDITGWRYEMVPQRDLDAQIYLGGVKFNNITDCRNEANGCDGQLKEFELAPVASYEENFNYRYLLAIDGKDVMPFMQSSSVAMRASIFRAWYEDRLTPWLHFIPLDIRLHGLHSTLAYFMGLQGTIGGREIKMPAMFTEAKWIADSGRKRVESVVRREDAEVYVFRLLLEWARVVDDDREQLGFRM